MINYATLRKLCILSFFILTILNVNAQSPDQPSTTIAPRSSDPEIARPDTIVRQYRDMVALGVGIGQDYGGFGINLIVYPQKNIGVFAGVGLAVAGVGYNAGIKLRMIPDAHYMKVSPYLTAMYGYNAAVKVMDEPEFDKLFYGPSAGGGIDLRFRGNKSYFSFGIIVPFRDNEVDEYMDMLEQEHNINFESGLIPVTISFGFKIIIT
jgi:hypothetical protein